MNQPFPQDPNAGQVPGQAQPGMPVPPPAGGVPVPPPTQGIPTPPPPMGGAIPQPGVPVPPPTQGIPTPPPPMGGAIPQPGVPVPPPGQGAQEDNQPVVPIGSFGKDSGFRAKIKIPAHNLNFDEEYFLKLLAGSISLSKDEKKRIIESVPKLSQYQIDELIKIFEEEKRKFSELDVKHKEQLRALEAKHAAEWESLEMDQEQDAQAGQEDAAAEDIRKSLGLGDE